MKFEESKGLFEQNPAKREEIIRANLDELERRKKEGEIDPEDYQLYFLYYLTFDKLPVCLSNVKINALHDNGQAINITQEELEILEEETKFNLQVVLADGKIITIDSEHTCFAKDDRLIIFPEELGEVPKAN